MISWFDRNAPRHLWACSGCRQRTCACPRSKMNLCFGCSSKLYGKEGKRFQWGRKIREFCAKCSASLPQTALVDGGK